LAGQHIAKTRPKNKKNIKHTILGIYMAGQHIAKTGPKKIKHTIIGILWPVSI
jgi:hypothetical protein